MPLGPSILDREQKNFYKLRLLAKDTGGLTEEAQLVIFITDVNDNAPVFEKLSVFKQTGIEILQYTDKMEIYFIDNAIKPLAPVAAALKSTSSFSQSQYSMTMEKYEENHSKPTNKVRRLFKLIFPFLIFL